MSLYWGYGCKTCETLSPRWLNRGDGDLEQIYREWPALRGVLETIEGAHWRLNVHFETDYTADILAFLKEHDGHALALCDEYGRTRDLPPPEPAPGWQTLPEQRDAATLQTELDRVTTFLALERERIAVLQAGLRQIARYPEAGMAEARTLHYDMRGWAARALREADELGDGQIFPEGARAYYRSLITVEVLSVDAPVPDEMRLALIEREFDEGAWSGEVVRHTQRVDWPTFKALLHAQRADPSCIYLKEDGSDDE